MRPIQNADTLVQSQDQLSIFKTHIRAYNAYVIFSGFLYNSRASEINFFFTGKISLTLSIN